MSDPSQPDREAMIAARDAAANLHAPVMLDEARQALDAARGGVFVDGTFGAGGYARGLLGDGADILLGLDRDPEAIARGEFWAPLYDGRLRLRLRRFSELDAATAEFGPATGIGFDLGVSSMQLDEGRRGFSFMRDGPLDMRMGSNAADEPSAADLIRDCSKTELANILYRYGEERASRRIARAIVLARAEEPIATAARLAEVIERAAPRRKSGAPHPATRSFQALRIAVNAELEELERGLAAAERALAPGGVLAVVSFHSLEDRIVKSFLRKRSGKAAGGSRYAPELNLPDASFEEIGRGAVAPSDAEIARNPRARSAKLRAARRTSAPPFEGDGT